MNTQGSVPDNAPLQITEELKKEDVTPNELKAKAHSNTPWTATEQYQGPTPDGGIVIIEEDNQFD